MKLVMANFVANNKKLTSTKLSLIIALRCLYPPMSFDIINIIDISFHKRINQQKPLNISNVWKNIKIFIKIYGSSIKKSIKTSPQILPENLL